MATPVKEVLVVGLGAVGAICKYFWGLYGLQLNYNRIQDSLILKNSGLARVTAVARSNYDAVNS